MCELLGMSANTPTDLCFSFTGLTRRGGETGPHKDGWGVAFYEGKGVRMFHDPEPCATSPIADFVSKLPIKVKMLYVIFVRLMGNINLANTHPSLANCGGDIRCLRTTNSTYRVGRVFTKRLGIQIAKSFSIL